MAVLAFIVACIVFVLAGVGVTFGDVSTLELVSLGLAALALGFLLPGAVAYLETRRSSRSAP